MPGQLKAVGVRNGPQRSRLTATRILCLARSIFFLEVCMYSVVCSNNFELFSVAAEQPFHCKLSTQGFRRLQHYLTDERTT